MANGALVTNNGKLIAFNRLWKAVPNYKTPTKFMVGTGTTTPTVLNTALQTPVDITAGVQIKSFVATYPVLDETTLNATIRCILLTTEANTNSLTEFGLVNEDGTPLLYSHAVHTAITKNTGVQIIYVEKDQII